MIIYISNPVKAIKPEGINVNKRSSLSMVSLVPRKGIRNRNTIDSGVGLSKVSNTQLDAKIITPAVNKKRKISTKIRIRKIDFINVR